MIRLRPALWLLSCLPVLTLAICAQEWTWQLPAGFPPPHVPANNPMSVAKVELGRYLFYDKRLSVNGKESCASCHRQELAFTDGRSRAEGTMGDLDPRSAMSLANVAYAPSLMWAHPTLDSLEDQALIPLLNNDPPELGFGGYEGNLDEFLTMARNDATYQRLFPRAFPGDTAMAMGHVAKALAAFERSIVSLRSPYDRYRAGDNAAISESAKRGEALFSSADRGGCVQCHGGWNFSSVRLEGETQGPANRGLFANTGVGVYEAPNRGLFERTGDSKDVGKFRVPTLRNIAVTDPYMHDGSLATLEEVIAHYEAGGRMNQPGKSPELRPFRFSEQEKQDLIEFLKSLTDEELLRDPRWSDPWPSQSVIGAQ
ncbi:MAG: MbnH family di-heme enzyme [Acidobacteriota bacterium]